MYQVGTNGKSKRCLICLNHIHQDTDMVRLLFRNDLLCVRCRSKWMALNRKFLFENIPARVLWKYNEAFSSALLQYKECCDEALKNIFLFPFLSQLKLRYRNYTLLCMPSTQSSLKRRGFHHLEQMFEQLELPIRNPFEKMMEVSQKDLPAQERKRIIGQVRLKEEVQQYRNILLIDDVLTTGSTLRAALACIDLKLCHVEILVCSKVESL